MAQNSNVSEFRKAQWQMVDNAINARDNDELKRLCREGLDDPFLPRLFRADFHIILSIFDDEDPHYRLDEATRAIEDMEQVLANAGETDEDENIAQLKQRVATLRGMIVESDDEDVLAVEGTEAVPEGMREEAVAQPITPAPPSSIDNTVHNKPTLQPQSSPPSLPVRARRGNSQRRSPARSRTGSPRKYPERIPQKRRSLESIGDQRVSKRRSLESIGGQKVSKRRSFENIPKRRSYQGIPKRRSFESVVGFQAPEQPARRRSPEKRRLEHDPDDRSELETKRKKES